MELYPNFKRCSWLAVKQKHGFQLTRRPCLVCYTPIVIATKKDTKMWNISPLLLPKQMDVNILDLFLVKLLKNKSELVGIRLEIANICSLLEKKIPLRYLNLWLKQSQISALSSGGGDYGFRGAKIWLHQIESLDNNFFFKFWG